MARRQPPPALDRTGTQAAIYPSEEQLWIQGPPINAPGGQVVVDLATAGAYDGASVAAQEAWIHETMNGETSNAAYVEDVVNNAVYGPQGFGDWNIQAYQTGHTQNVVSDPAKEQGWGVGPARRWAHYPKTESPNRARNLGQHFRNGQLPWVSVESSLYERSQLAREQHWAPWKMRSPVAPVVPVPPSVPYVQVVPTYSGGPEGHPGVDFPETGIYWWQS